MNSSKGYPEMEVGRGQEMPQPFSSPLPLSAKKLSSNLIEHDYNQWLEYYDQLSRAMADESVDTEEGELAHQRAVAISLFKRVLTYPASIEQQFMKIIASLLLIKLHESELEQGDREAYFYRAVEMAQEIWEDIRDTDYGKYIIDVYLSHIDLIFWKSWTGDVQELRRRVYGNIIFETNERRNARISKAADDKSYLYDQVSTEKILNDLEEVFGPMQLFIVGKESQEEIVNYPSGAFRMEDLEFSHAYDIRVDIFGKSTDYTVIIKKEFGSLFGEHQLKNIINPRIERYIKNKEHFFFISAADNAYTIEMAESSMDMPRETNDYSAFIKSVIANSMDSVGLHESEDVYVGNFMQALDICRIITLQPQIHRKKLLSEIDRILWWRVKRRVLDIVNYMLLSRNETMNGAGSLGMNKWQIPLEWKIYSVIRAYEALMACCPRSEEALRRMAEWTEWMYFDSRIHKIFFHAIHSSGWFPKKQPYALLSSRVSEDREEVYNSYIHPWYRIMELTREIWKQHDIARNKIDERLRKETFKKINSLVWELMQEADLMIIVAFSRHGEAESDIEGVPGGQDDPLTPEWEKTSREIWKKCAWLEVEMHSSDVLRAQMTAELMRDEIISQVYWLLSMKPNDISKNYPDVLCPIRREESLINPDKSQEGFWKRRTDSWLSRIILGENTKILTDFLENITSQLIEKTHLLVTHGHQANIINTLLENLALKNSFEGKKISMKNGEMRVYVIRWNGNVTHEGDGFSSLFFPITEWSSVLSEINSLTKSMFWEIFYDPTGRLTNPIMLHREFLDFVDYKKGTPKKLVLFLKHLEENPTTSHFSDILKMEKERMERKNKKIT